jgi:hypothetical protein
MPACPALCRRCDERDSIGACHRRLAEERTALDPGEAPRSAPADGPSFLRGAAFPMPPRPRGAGKVGGEAPAAACAGRRSGRARKRRLGRSRAARPELAPPMQRPQALGSERRPVTCFHCLFHRLGVADGGTDNAADDGGRLQSLYAPNTRKV